MKLIFHGAAREVGRSCIELKTQGDRYIFDAGIKFKESGFEYPDSLFNLPSIDGVFLTHAHLDHTGSLPMFEHNNIICPFYATKLTYELTKILLKDSYKIARIRNLHPAFNRTDLKKVGKSMRFVKYDQQYKHRLLQFTYRNAGHVPGSACIEVKCEGKKIVYTGDWKLRANEIVKDAYTNYKDVDCLITEATYGNRDHPSRQETRDRLIKRVKEVTKAGGSVIIPVFALGRAQDVLVILADAKLDVPIYYDGMCAKMGRKMVDAKDDPYIENRKKLTRMMTTGATHVSSEKRRMAILKKPGVFITTSGMLQGGPVMSYLKELWHDPKNAVFLTGFQCKRTNGRHLLEEGYVYMDGWKTYVKCQVENYSFSGHSDQSELKEFITKIKPKNLVFMHGDEEEIEMMKTWAEQNTKCKVYAPHIGDEIEL
jgi:putative mRNA 3-end processing factor